MLLRTTTTVIMFAIHDTRSPYTTAGAEGGITLEGSWERSKCRNLHATPLSVLRAFAFFFFLGFSASLLRKPASRFCLGIERA